jgi:hypothetical protein
MPNKTNTNITAVKCYNTYIHFNCQIVSSELTSGSDASGVLHITEMEMKDVSEATTCFSMSQFLHIIHCHTSQK